MQFKTRAVTVLMVVFSFFLFSHAISISQEEERGQEAQEETPADLLKKIYDTFPRTKLKQEAPFSAVVKTSLMFRYRDKINVVLEGGWPVVDMYFRLIWKNDQLRIVPLQTEVHRLFLGENSGRINQEKIMLSRFLKVNEQRFLVGYQRSVVDRLSFYFRRFMLGVPFSRDGKSNVSIEKLDDGIVLTEPLTGPALAEYLFEREGAGLRRFRLSHMRGIPAPYSPAYPVDARVYEPEFVRTELDNALLLTRLNGQVRQQNYNTALQRDPTGPNDGLGLSRSGNDRNRIQVWTNQELEFLYRSERIHSKNRDIRIHVPSSITVLTSERIIDRRPFRMEFSGNGFRSGGTALLNRRDTYHVYTETFEFLRYRFGEEVKDTDK